MIRGLLCRLGSPSADIIDKALRDIVQKYTSVLPNVPAAWIRNMGFDAVAAACGVGGLPMKVSLSQEGSSSERASRSHEDWNIIGQLRA